MSELKLTDADLARLEELSAHYASGNALPFAEAAYRESACNATPALVAEVRRLRAAKTISLDYMRSLHDSEQEKIAALQARVEELEKNNKHLEETACVLAEQVGKGNLGKIQDALNYAHYKASEREAIR